MSDLFDSYDINIYSCVQLSKNSCWQISFKPTNKVHSCFREVSFNDFDTVDGVLSILVKGASDNTNVG